MVGVYQAYKHLLDEMAVPRYYDVGGLSPPLGRDAISGKGDITGTEILRQAAILIYKPNGLKTKIPKNHALNVEHKDDIIVDKSIFAIPSQIKDLIKNSDATLDIDAIDSAVSKEDPPYPILSWVKEFLTNNNPNLYVTGTNPFWLERVPVSEFYKSDPVLVINPRVFYDMVMYLNAKTKGLIVLDPYNENDEGKVSKDGLFGVPDELKSLFGKLDANLKKTKPLDSQDNTADDVASVESNSEEFAKKDYGNKDYVRNIQAIIEEKVLSSKNLKKLLIKPEYFEDNPENVSMFNQVNTSIELEEFLDKLKRDSSNNSVSISDLLTDFGNRVLTIFRTNTGSAVRGKTSPITKYTKRLASARIKDLIAEKSKIMSSFKEDDSTDQVAFLYDLLCDIYDKTKAINLLGSTKEALNMDYYSASKLRSGDPNIRYDFFSAPILPSSLVAQDDPRVQRYGKTEKSEGNVALKSNFKIGSKYQNSGFRSTVVGVSFLSDSKTGKNFNVYKSKLISDQFTEEKDALDVCVLHINLGSENKELKTFKKQVVDAANGVDGATIYTFADAIDKYLNAILEYVENSKKFDVDIAEVDGMFSVDAKYDKSMIAPYFYNRVAIYTKRRRINKNPDELKTNCGLIYNQILDQKNYLADNSIDIGIGAVVFSNSAPKTMSFEDAWEKVAPMQEAESMMEPIVTDKETENFIANIKNGVFEMDDGGMKFYDIWQNRQFGIEVAYLVTIIYWILTNRKKNPRVPWREGEKTESVRENFSYVVDVNDFEW